MYKEIKQCRICGNNNLTSVLDLGSQYLTGVFPKDKNTSVTSGPLELVKCHSENNAVSCGLLQLKHSYALDEMYGLNYGYRSGLNRSMVAHLHDKVRKICKQTNLLKGDAIIDIGSNDSTLLQGYLPNDYLLIGVDPTGKKFHKYYPDHIHLLPDFFSAQTIKDNFGSKKAKVVTSISMFYDLESPVDFMMQVYDILADDGIWVFEQSYMPAMLELNSYDTICHEHLEYYSLKQIKWMADRVGFKIIDVEFNDINGGSFSATVSKKDSAHYSESQEVDKILSDENEKGLNGAVPYQEFKTRVYKHRDELKRFIQKINNDNKMIFGYGASTKGNVILQFCNITEKDIPFIAEVNVDKFGSYTPGSLIPIISEEEAKAMNPDYFMVLPWHFKNNIISKEKEYLESGGKLFFPLPGLEIVER